MDCVKTYLKDVIENMTNLPNENLIAKLLKADGWTIQTDEKNDQYVNYPPEGFESDSSLSSDEDNQSQVNKKELSEFSNDSDWDISSSSIEEESSNHTTDQYNES